MSFFDDEDEAHDAFNLFDLNGDGSSNKDELAWTIKAAFKEKRSLVAALSDLSSVIDSFNHILYFLSGFATFIIALPILNIAWSSVVSLSTFFLALSFAFGSTAQATFNGLVFVFWMQYVTLN